MCSESLEHAGGERHWGGAGTSALGLVRRQLLGGNAVRLTCPWVESTGTRSTHRWGKSVPLQIPMLLIILPGWRQQFWEEG